MSNFVLDDNEILISPAREEYNTIRQKYQMLAEYAASQFSNSYAVNFKSIDDVHEKCTVIMMSLLEPVVEVAIQDLIEYKVYDVDINQFEAYFSDHFTWDNDFAVIDEKYLSIVMKAEELDAYRTERRQSRGQWVGGGFGIEGAVKGAMKAGALNIATGAMHGTFNLMAKGVNAVGDAMKKSALYDDPETKSHLTAAVYKVILNTHFALINAINEEKPTTISGFVSKEDASKAKRLLENVSKGRIPQELIKSQLIQINVLNPYEYGFYTYWINEYGDKYGELESIESHFGIAVSSEFKKDLISVRKATLDLSTPESCETSLIDLEEYAKSIGYLGFAKEKLELLKLKKQLDRERRTVQGVEYKTIEAASKQREIINLEIIRSDNTIVSSGFDIGRIAFGLVCVIIAGASAASKASFLMVAVPLALAIYSFQNVRSIRAMKFAGIIGYTLVALGSGFLAGVVVSAAFGAGQLIASEVLVFFAIIAVGWGLGKLIRKRYQEAGYAVPIDYIIRVLIVGSVIGGALSGILEIFVPKENLAPKSVSSNTSTKISAPDILNSSATSISVAADPSPNLAFVDLYGINLPKSDEVTLSSGESVKIWYSGIVTADIGKRFLVIVQRSRPENTSYADGANLDMVSYREEKGKWTLDAKARELFKVGSNGIASPLDKEELNKIEKQNLKQGLTGIFLPISGSNQGYSTDFFNIIGIGNGVIEFLGMVEVGGENSGACDSSIKDASSTCYNWKGRLSVKPLFNGNPGNILIHKTGTEIIDSRVVPAAQSTYSWESGKGYVPSSN